MKNEIIHNQAIYVPAEVFAQASLDAKAEKLTSYINIFKAFSSLSNAQEMMAQSGCINEEANDAYNFINEAKQLLQASISQTEEDLDIYRQAMFLGMHTDA